MVNGPFTTSVAFGYLRVFINIDRDVSDVIVTSGITLSTKYKFSPVFGISLGELSINDVMADPLSLVPVSWL
jgi:hypothetical protein